MPAFFHLNRFNHQKSVVLALGSLLLAVAVAGCGSGGSLSPLATPSTASIDFGSVLVGTHSVQHIVTLTNPGLASLSVASVTLTGSGAAQFSLTNGCNVPVAPGASCNVSLTFSPQAVGPQAASLIFSDNAPSETQTVALTGTGVMVAPTLTASLTPGALTFASTSVGTTTAAQSATLTNTGTGTLTLAGIAISGANASSFADTSTCGASLAVAASCTISVTFTPTAPGALSASLSVSDNATSSPQTVSLSGTGATVAPTLTVTLTPSALMFASTNVGSTSAAQMATLTNTGTGSVTIAGIAITGAGASSFADTSTCGATLAVAASCTISVTFTPTAPGAFSASLSVSDNAVGSPQTVALSGTGVGVPAATLTPPSLTFASTNIGVASATQAATLTNTGTGVLTISGISIAGAGAASFSDVSGCGGTLAVNASCMITVTFKPVAAGTQSASLTVSDNAAGTPQTVALSGIGVGVPTATLLPGVLTFAATNIGTSTASQNATLTNTGTGVLNISAIGISGANATSFTDVSGCGATLNPTASCTIAVTFTPTAVGPLTATLTVTDNAAGSPQSVTLNGTGVGVPAATLLPGMLNFGSAPLNTATSAQTSTLTSTGTAPLIISSVGLTGSSTFTQTNNCPGSLSPNANCTISVVFKPTAVQAYTGTVTVADNAAGSPQTVALTGSGGGAPVATITPSGLSFGEVIKLTASAAQTLTVKNTGTSPLTITGFTFNGTNATSFSQTNTCTAASPLAVNASCTVTVTATPANIGYLAASIAIADNAANSPQSIQLAASGVKDHFKGIVAMNNSKTVNGGADNTLEEINIHPNLYVGAVIKFYWSQLEPSQGVFDNTAIEAALNNIKTYNAKYPAGPFVTAKIRITASANVPTWLYADAGSVQSSDGEFADFWNAEYTKQWRALNAWLASKYDLDERVQEIAISSCASSTDEPFVLLHTSSDITAFKTAGYTDAQYHTCLNGAGDDYAAFHFTQIDFTFNGEQSIDTGKDVSSQQDANVIMDNFRTNYPVRSIVANHGLANTSTSGQTYIYPNFTLLYNNAQAMPTPPVRNYGLEFQTDSPSDNWDSAITECESYHCTEFEIWDTKAAGGPGTTTVQQLQTAAAGIPKD